MSKATTEQNIQDVLHEIIGSGEDMLQECLATLTADDDAPTLQGISTFDEVGMMSREKGLVLLLSNGAEFQITIKRSR